MPRPALVVGLGGTGQWVLTWLKRDLLLSNNGEMPRNVRLLSIDTTTQLEAGVRMVGGRQEEAIRIGSVGLSSNEFIYIGGDSRPLAERVKAGGMSNIGQWYHAKRWLDMLPPSAFILDDGAGRIRQFGRVAVFKDILGRQANSRIWRALRNAIRDVNTKVSTQRNLEIIVVGSFAGGTGSGMFLDVALILRLLAQQEKVHHTLRGFFALPSVFTPAPDSDMKARTFAAWRELNRFMVVNSDFPMPLIEYVEDDPMYRIRPTQRIFDSCYLVDSTRGGTPIAAEPRMGVHPMVAEVISAILDEHAGTAYSQGISQNLAPEYTRTPEVPLYSAVGAFTVQVPAHYLQEVTTHQFTEGVLLSLLAPRDRTLASTGAKRHLELAAPDLNQEIGIGVAGRKKCKELLSSETVSYGGETAKPTQFTARVAELVTETRDSNKRAQTVDALARAGGAVARPGATSGSWVGYFTNLGDDPMFEQLRRNVQTEVSYNLLSQYGRRKGEKPDEVRNRFKGISDDVRKRYGGLTSVGVETHGTFGDRLSDCKDFHLTLFRRLVKLRLLGTLMGRSEQNPTKSKSGKLGYAWDYFDGLVDEFEEFLALMDDVKRRREEVKPEIRLQGLSQNAQSFMGQKSDAKVFWVFEAPVVKRSEDAYLQAQQRVVDLRKEDLLHTYVVDTARAMMDVCIDARDAIQRWIWHLSTGDEPSKMPGLWTEMQRNLKMVKDDHSYDTAMPTVQRLLADQAPPIPDEDIAAALGQWEWDASFTADTLQLELVARINPEAPGETPLLIGDPSTASTEALRKEAGQRNYGFLGTLARRRYAGIASRTTIQAEVKGLYPEPADFSTQIAPGAEPLFDGDLKATPRKKSNLIRVQTAPNDSYFYGASGLEGVLRKEQQLPEDNPDDVYRIAAVNSENPYKLTLMRTDDLYVHEAFSAWGDCLEAYAGCIAQEGEPQDPVLMHNFSAEAQAVVFERALRLSDETYRPLHPRVVMLLENPRALRQFVYLGMLSMVQEREERQMFRWELSWTKSGRPQTLWLTRGWNAETDRKDRPIKPDILNAMHGYVVMGKTWQPQREDRIDYEFADVLIKNEQKKLGLAGESKLLTEHLSDHGFVGWLRSLAYDPDVTDRVLRQDYADLAKVITMLLEERLADLADQQKPVSTSPFSVRRAPGSDAQVSAAQEESPQGMSSEKAVDQADDTDSHSFSPFSTRG